MQKVKKNRKEEKTIKKMGKEFVLYLVQAVILHQTLISDP